MSFLHKHPFRKSLSVLITTTLLNLCLFPAANAETVSTAQLLQQSQVAERRTELSGGLARDDVRRKLLAYGVSNEVIDQRLNNLTDAEITQLHERMATLPAGQGLLGTAIGLIVIFMLLDIAGVTDIFPNI